MGHYVSFNKVSKLPNHRNDELDIVGYLNNNIVNEDLNIFLTNNPYLNTIKMPQFNYYKNDKDEETCKEIPILLAIRNKNYTEALRSSGLDISKYKHLESHFRSIIITPNIDRVRELLDVNDSYSIEEFTTIDRYNTTIVLINNTNKQKKYDKKPYSTINHSLDSWEGYKLYDIETPVLGYSYGYALDTRWNHLFNSIPKDISNVLCIDKNCYDKDKINLLTPYVKKDMLEQWMKGINEWDDTSYVSYG